MSNKQTPKYNTAKLLLAGGVQIAITFAAIAIPLALFLLSYALVLESDTPVQDWAQDNETLFAASGLTIVVVISFVIFTRLKHDYTSDELNNHQQC